MDKFKRKSGIESLGDIPWGSRVFMFYRNEDEMLDIIAPYFRAGLKNNELCLWITSGTAEKETAKNTLKKNIIDFDQYLEKGQLKIISHSAWCLKDGLFDALKTIKNRDNSVKQAAAGGLEGLRAAFDLGGLNKDGRQRFMEFIVCDEDTLKKQISIYALSADGCGLPEIIDIVSRHEMVLFNRNGRWSTIKKKDERTARDVLLSAEQIEINGEPCVLAVTTDITEKRQSEEIFRSISLNSPFGIYIIQEDRIQYSNPYFRKITGFNQRELSGMEFLDLVAVEDKDVVKANTISVLKGPAPYPCEYRILNKKGQIRWVMQTAFSIRYMNRPALLGNIMDITERKSLERKVTEFEELNKMKSNLISNVSHELRTPLATIKGYASMILDYFPLLSVQEKKDYIESIESSSDRLAKLIEDLLETSRLESGLVKLKKSPASISGLIRDVTGKVQAKTNHHTFSLDLDKRLPRVLIDVKHICQVMENLIDNAVKCSPPGTGILISGNKYGRELVIGVTDRGPGIPAEELPKIFDRMFQVEEKQYYGKEGIGLGLYICRHLIEAHGGRIWAESAPFKGNTVKFTLPIHKIVKQKTKKTVTEKTGEMY
jgi:PAS domain S-box-containing protein